MVTCYGQHLRQAVVGLLALQAVSAPAAVESLTAEANLPAETAHSSVDVESSTTSNIVGDCPPDDTDLGSVSEVDVQQLLKNWNLDRAFAKEFQEQQVSGYHLQSIDMESVDLAAYPSAQKFHWKVLMRRLADCGFLESGRGGSPNRRDDNNNNNNAKRGRRLSELGVQADHPGLWIKSNTSSVVLGTTGDVSLTRSNENQLTMDNNLRFCEGNGVQFCNEEGGDVSITSDGQGNLYIGGTVHFENATFSGVHFENYVSEIFDVLSANFEGGACAGGSCATCKDILDSNATATDGVYLMDPDGVNFGVDPMYAYCDMTNGGWTLLMRYGESGYHASFNFDEAEIPTSSGGESAPTDQVWCPMPSGNDDGHLAMTPFNLAGKTLRAACDDDGDYYTYDTDYVSSWTKGVHGTYEADGTDRDPVGWVVLSGNDIGVAGYSHHYICGAQSYSGCRGIGFCDGGGSSGAWTPHLASVSFWPTSMAVGCNGVDGDAFELWLR